MTLEQAEQALFKRAAKLSEEVKEADKLFNLLKLTQKAKEISMGIEGAMKLPALLRDGSMVFYTQSEIEHKATISRMASERLEKYFIKKVEELNK